MLVLEDLLGEQGLLHAGQEDGICSVVFRLIVDLFKSGGGSSIYIKCTLRQSLHVQLLVSPFAIISYASFLLRLWHL